MRELLISALGGDVESLQGLAALVSIIAILPAAFLFIINQWRQNSLLRNERHRYVTDQYHAFLDRCVALPQLRLGPYESVADTRLTEAERYQRDTLFDLLTSIFESAYLAYANRTSSHRRRQWGGWDRYIDMYVHRSDYRDWWWRVIFSGDREYLNQDDAEIAELNPSQLDLQFELYMVYKLRPFDWAPGASIASDETGPEPTAGDSADQSPLSP